MTDLTPEDRAWLRKFDEALQTVRKTDLGEDPRKLGKIRERFAMDPRYADLAMQCADIMAHHRDRLIGKPSFSRDEGGKLTIAWERAVDERAARIAAFMREPEAAPELSAPAQGGE